MLDVAIFCLLPLREYNPPRKDGRSLPHSPFVCQRAREKLKNAQLLRAAQMAAFSVSFLMFVLGFPFCCCPCGRVDLRI
jgi:hypothetical protein